MKKCSWCGLEYPDTTTTCPTDGTTLVETVPALLVAAVAPVPSEPPPLAIPATRPELPDRRLRIIELFLVCLLAFGGSLLVSTFTFLGFGSTSSDGRVLRWTHSILHAASCLGLLWYVLARRSKSFRDLGVSWTLKDLGWSVAVYVVASFGFGFVYGFLRSTGLAPTSLSTTSRHVAEHLFPGGVTVVAFVYQFINPFFEESIARGYVMTEVIDLTGSAWKAVALSTLMQMSYHFYQGAPAALSHGAVFLVFSIFYARTRRLAPVILAHLYFDVGSTLLYALRHL